MAITAPQTNIEAHGSAATLVKAYTSAVGSGDLLVAAVGWGSATGSITSVKDSVNGATAWTQVGTTQQGNGLSAALFYFNGTAAGTPTVTVTFSGALSSEELVLWVFHSSLGWKAGTAVLDIKTQATGSGSNANPGSLVTTNASDVMLSYTVVGGSCTAGSASWTYFTTTTNSDGIQYRIVTSTGTYVDSFTSTGGFAAIAAAFAESSVTTLHFPMAIVDTSGVVLGLENNRHLPVQVADTSTVVALGFEIAGATQTLFLPTDTPASTGSFGSGLTTGTAFFVSAATNALAIRFYKASPSTTTSFVVNLWDVSGATSLASQTVSGVSGSNLWVEATLTTAVALTANKAYRVSVYDSIGSYCYTGSYFTSSFTRGSITGYADATVPPSSGANGSFISGNGNPTNSSGVAANYWVDVRIGTAAAPSFPVLVADTSTVTLGLENNRHFPLAVTDTSSATLQYEVQRHFTLAIADTSTVVALGLENNRHFTLQVADTSTVVALGLEVNRRFPVQVADTSTVVALGLEVNRHLLLQVADTSTVLTLGLSVGRHFPVQVADTSSVALGFHIAGLLHFPMAIADTSAVVALRFETQRHFPLVIADTSTVLIGFHLTVPVALHFPLAITDTSAVSALGFRVQRSGFGLHLADTGTVRLSFGQSAPSYPVRVATQSTVWLRFQIFVPPLNPVPRYTGVPQEQEIVVPATIYYREVWEEGPWVMPPYAWIYPPAPEPVIEERGSDQVHHEWLKTHPRPPGPRRLGDHNHRPQSVLPPFVRTPPIKVKPRAGAPPRRMGDPHLSTLNSLKNHATSHKESKLAE